MAKTALESNIWLISLVPSALAIGRTNCIGSRILALRRFGERLAT
jgi:hypothetical protein